MKYSLLMTVGAASLLGGCSKTSEYTPAEGMSGEAIFQTVCAECHQQDDEGYYFELDRTADIGKTVRGGGLMMPSFPHIGGDSLRSLQDYVMAHSRMAE